MKISHVLVGGMFILFFVFAIYGIITFDISIQEVRKLISSRNEVFSFNVMQDLDQQIEKRITALDDLTKLHEIQDALVRSNEKFRALEELTQSDIIPGKEFDAISISSPQFMAEAQDRQLTKELQKTIALYKDEYDFDVLQEIFVTNAYGANIALGSELYDHNDDDKDWWHIAQEKGIYYGQLQYRDEYNKHSMDFAFRITDEENNFLGVMRVLITIDDIIDIFIQEVDLLKLPNRNVLLLDNLGRAVYSDGIQNFEESLPVEYFSLVEAGKDTGSFELISSNDVNLIAYSKSTGYKSFEGFDWVVVVDQKNSSFVDEFVDLKNSIIVISIIGMIASILIGLGISQLVSKPLRHLTNMAKSISNGNFEVRAKKSSVTEINIIGNSFNTMAESIEKLIETEKQLAEAHVQVKNERFTAIGELAANVAHDLKNPLATIRSSAEILKRHSKDQDPELVKVIERMDRAISRMSHQIEGVLNYVRTTPINMTSISIRTLLDSAVETLEVPNNITLILPETKEKITCDAKKFEIVFTNLILNAIQAIGKNTGTIYIRVKTDNFFTIIEFEDTGSGIPEKLLTKIFEPLVTTKEKGTGLGLSSCKNIVEQHGGIIMARNNPTTFIVKIPMSP